MTPATLDPHHQVGKSACKAARLAFSTAKQTSLRKSAASIRRKNFQFQKRIGSVKANVYHVGEAIAARAYEHRTENLDRTRASKRRVLLVHGSQRKREPGRGQGAPTGCGRGETALRTKGCRGTFPTTGEPTIMNTDKITLTLTPEEAKWLR